MAEKKDSEKKKHNALRAYLVYDYILKRNDFDSFQIGKLNA